MLDPVTTEVINNRLDEICRVMQHRLFHAGYSATLRESLDGSTGMTTAAAELIRASGLALHGLQYSSTVAAVLRRWGVSRIHDGDTFVLNDPYWGGNSHSPDMAVVTPVFVNGDLVAFCASIAHKPDLGGLGPGTVSPDSRSKFHEGLLLPPVKLFEAGVLSESVEDILRNNSRLPNLLLGDLHSQVGCTRIGAQLFQGLCEEYGVETVLGSISFLMDASERRVREELARLPDAVAEGENWLDDDGVDPERPVRIHVQATKRADTIEFDLSKCAPQVPGPFNLRPTGVRAACVAALISFLDDTILINEGVIRAITWQLRPGSIVNANAPAPTGTYWPATHLVYTSVTRALGQIAPKRAIAEQGLGAGAVTFAFDGVAGSDSRLVYDILGTAYGATSTSDGASMMFPVLGYITIHPIENMENEVPVRVRDFSARMDSAGAGLYRGGLAYRREYQVLEPCSLINRLGLHRFASSGAAGGGQPLLPRLVVRRAATGQEIVLRPVSTAKLEQNDVVIVEQSGGGGYGDPFQRPADLVLDDVLDGYVSEGAARSAYGVALTRNSTGLAVDVVNTARIRASEHQDTLADPEPSKQAG